MARIKVGDMKRVEKERTMVHEWVPATYTVFSEEGERFFQIDTYGKKPRKYPEKVSQSLQFDRENACQLIKLLRQEFELDQ